MAKIEMSPKRETRARGIGRFFPGLCPEPGEPGFTRLGIISPGWDWQTRLHHDWGGVARTGLRS